MTSRLPAAAMLFLFGELDLLLYLQLLEGDITKSKINRIICLHGVAEWNLLILLPMATHANVANPLT